MYFHNICIILNPLEIQLARTARQLHQGHSLRQGRHRRGKDRWRHGGPSPSAGHPELGLQAVSLLRAQVQPFDGRATYSALQGYQVATGAA